MPGKKRAAPQSSASRKPRAIKKRKTLADSSSEDEAEDDEKNVKQHEDVDQSDDDDDDDAEEAFSASDDDSDDDDDDDDGDDVEDADERKAPSPILTEKDRRLQAVRNRFIKMCEAEGGQMSDEKLKNNNGQDSLADLAKVINALLVEGRLHLYTNTAQMIQYRLLDEDTREMLKDLSDQDMNVYDVIAESEQKGIWIKDLKRRTRLQDKDAKKCLKLLQSRGLVKSVRSIAGKNRRVYMLQKLEPSREVVGGPWYSSGDHFDHDFVAALNRMVYELLKRGGPKTAQELCTLLKQNEGLFSDDVEVGENDLANLIYAMELDGTLRKQVRIPVLAEGQTLREYIENPDRDADCMLPTSDVIYELVENEAVSTRCYESKSSSSSSSSSQFPLTSTTGLERTNPKADNTLAHSVCVTCPLQSQCSDDGVINPRDCPYLKIVSDTAAGLELF